MATKKTKETRKTTTKAPAKTKEPKQFADGKDDRMDLAKTVEELMSVNTRDPFQLASGESFEEAVSTMALSDLQEIAVKAGVFPSGTKVTLKNKLLKEYDNRARGKYGASSRTKPCVDPKSKQAKDILRIINE
jgi:hypothetical protein